MERNRGGTGTGRRKAAGAGRGLFVGRDEHRRPRDTGGTHPGRISEACNVETPWRSAHHQDGRPIARAAECLPGHKRTREAKAGS